MEAASPATGRHRGEGVSLRITWLQADEGAAYGQPVDPWLGGLPPRWRPLILLAVKWIAGTRQRPDIVIVAARSPITTPALAASAMVSEDLARDFLRVDRFGCAHR